MAKWGSFHWGDGTKWGTGAAVPQVAPTGRYTWMLLVNWAGNWVNEANLCIGVRGTRGRKYYIAQGGETFEKIQPGEYYFTMANKDRRYDPYNAASPLNGNIKPGKEVHLRVKDNQTGTSYQVFFGRIRDIRPVSGEEKTEIIVMDPFQLLADSDISSFETKFNISVSDAIYATLKQDNIYPYGIEVGASSCPITYFNPGLANAFDVLRELEDAGLGTMFVDNKGTFHYYALNTSGQTVHTLTQDKLLKVIEVSQPWENIRNKITVTANRYGYGVTQEMWRSDESIYVEAGSIRQLKIEFDEGRLIQPVKMVDYMDDARPVVSGGVISWGHYFDAWLSNIQSTTALLNIANRDPSSAQWLAWIAIRGNPIVNKKISFESLDTDSMAAYGRRALRIDTPYLQDRGHAEAYAALLQAFLKDPHKNITVELQGRPDAFPIDLLDQVHLDIDALGIDETFDVGKIEFQWLSETGQDFKHKVSLHNILYSSATITPTPYIPANPPVPTNPGPGGPGGSTTNPGEGGPTYQQTMTCLEDLVPQGSNGPYTTGQNTVIENAKGGASYNAGLWFRTKYNPNRTYVTIDGVWQSKTGEVWVNDASWDFASVEAYDIYNHQIFAGGLSANGAVADGVRYYLFENTLKYYVKFITFRFAALSGDYSKVGTTPVFTGSVAGNSNTPTPITGLTPGALYCVEPTSGYKWNPIYQDSTCMRLVYSGSAVPSPNGFGWANFTGTVLTWINNGLVANRVLQINDLGYPNFRTFFKAEANMGFITGDEARSDNTGTLGIAIYPATDNNRRVLVRSVNFYNVCQGAPSSSPM
jgi:hypothetical protein